MKNDNRLTDELLNNVAIASSRVVCAFMRNAPAGTNAGETIGAVFAAFGKIARMEISTPVPHPLEFLPSPKRQRKYNANKPRKYNPTAVIKIEPEFKQTSITTNGPTTGNWRRLS